MGVVLKWLLLFFPLPLFFFFFLVGACFGFLSNPEAFLKGRIGFSIFAWLCLTQKAVERDAVGHLE